MAKTLYDACLKSTGAKIFEFWWWPGMGPKNETLAGYMKRRWHGNVVARPHVEEVAAS